MNSICTEHTFCFSLKPKMVLLIEPNGILPFDANGILSSNLPTHPPSNLGDTTLISASLLNTFL